MKPENRIKFPLKSKKYTQYIQYSWDKYQQKPLFDNIFCFNSKSGNGWAHWFDNLSNRYVAVKRNITIVININTTTGITEWRK